MSALARRWKQCYLGGGWVGNRGTKARRSTRPQANLPTPPDEQQSSDSPPTAEAMATTLPQGEFHSVPCVCFRSILCYNFNCAACCLRLLDVVPVVSRSLHRLARSLRAALRRYSSGAARIRLCCCYTAVLCTCVGRTAVCVIHLR